MTSHLSNCEHTLQLMLLDLNHNKAHSIANSDWLAIVQKTHPCLDCLAFFDQKAQESDHRLWDNDLLKRLDYIKDQRRIKK
jgi:hypothetical protein